MTCIHCGSDKLIIYQKGEKQDRYQCCGCGKIIRRLQDESKKSRGTQTILE